LSWTHQRPDRDRLRLLLPFRFCISLSKERRRSTERSTVFALYLFEILMPQMITFYIEHLIPTLECYFSPSCWVVKTLNAEWLLQLLKMRVYVEAIVMLGVSELIAK